MQTNTFERLVERLQRDVGSLSACVIYDKPDLLRTLLKSGVDPDTKDYYARRPLYLALKHGDAEGTCILLRHGAEINAVLRPDVDVCSGIGPPGTAGQRQSTAVYVVRAMDRHEILPILCERGVDLSDFEMPRTWTFRKKIANIMMEAHKARHLVIADCCYCLPDDLLALVYEFSGDCVACTNNGRKRKLECPDIQWRWMRY